MKRIVMMILLTALLLVGCASKEATWQEQYDLGMRYLSESNYEESLFAFSQAIAIDPKNADAYLGRAEAYLAAGGEENRTKATADYLTAADLCIDQGNLVRAEEILNEALEAIGESQMIRDKIEEIDGDTADRLYENQYYDDGTLRIGYEYDENHNMIKENHYKPDGSLEYTAEYDASSQVKKLVFYNNDKSIWYYEVYEYDEYGKRVRENIYEGNDRLNAYRINEYGESEKPIKTSVYSPDGKLNQYTTYSYGLDGKLTKVSWYDSDGNLEREDQYDENGNVVN